MVEEMPHYGTSGMYQLASDLKKQTAWVMDKTKDRGEVIVGFTVTTKGQILNTHVVESGESKILDASAIKIIKKLNNWKPGKQCGKAVNVDLTVPVEIYKYSPVAKRIPINVNKKVCVRLVKQVSRSREVRVYATSLLDEGQYSRKSIINLYKQRWGVEEAYKTLKARLDVIHFSGKTLHAVQQDFYARVFLISLTSILKAEIKPVLKTKPSSNNKNGRLPMINNSFAI